MSPCQSDIDHCQSSQSANHCSLGQRNFVDKETHCLGHQQHHGNDHGYDGAMDGWIGHFSQVDGDDGRTRWIVADCDRWR
jgi:hypothetical protein